MPAPPKDVRPPRMVTGVEGGRERWCFASLGTMGKQLGLDWRQQERRWYVKGEEVVLRVEVIHVDVMFGEAANGEAGV